MTAAPLPPPLAASLILRNGKVWAGKDLPCATAVALRGEEILAVGSDDEALRLAGSETRVIDLAGRLVVPGFNDAHLHLLAGGHGLLSVDLRPARDEADLARRLGAHVAGRPEGSWVREGNWDHEAWPSRALPTRATIDPVTPRHPVFVQRLDGHLALANSLALELAGIGRETPDPPGGAIDRDGRGEPTGILKDTAMELVRKVIPPPSFEADLEAARAAFREAARLGVTSVQDNSGPRAVSVYLELKARGELTARVSVWLDGASLPDLAAAGIVAGLGDDWVRLGAVKLFTDGSMGAGTAAFFEPYTDEPANRGLLVNEPVELTRLVLAADAAGFPLAVHAIGDRANAVALDAFAELVATRDPRPRRLRIEHAQVVREEDLERFRELGVTASIQPSHAVDDLRWAERRIGPERLANAYRLGSFLAKGIPVAFGTDWFVEPLDPRLTLYAAVTRELPGGGPPGGFNGDEKVSLSTALDLATRGPAFAEGTDLRKGTLEPGKLADLVVFGEDLFALERTDPRGILTAPVDLTVAGGRIVFDRSSAEIGAPR